MAANGQGIEPALLDDIINRLLEFRNARTVRQVQLSENEIRALCTTSREIFLSQPNLLELEAPIKICGTAFASISSFFSSMIELFDVLRIVVGFGTFYEWLMIDESRVKVRAFFFMGIFFMSIYVYFFCYVQSY